LGSFRLARWRLVLKDPLFLSANLAAHSLSKVFFTFFGLSLAGENGQDRFFFLEDIHALIMACKIVWVKPHRGKLGMLLMSCETLPQ